MNKSLEIKLSITNLSPEASNSENKYKKIVKKNYEQNETNLYFFQFNNLTNNPFSNLNSQ
jgi:hypothetical protein